VARSKSLQARALLRPHALLYMYRNRLRVHAVQELLAGLGVAVAVALVFAVTVANSSIAGSATHVVHTVVGPANLQLRARSSDGFDESLLAHVEHLPGVKQAAPLLEQNATILGPHGRRITVDLAGTDLSLGLLDGLAHVLPISTLESGGITLSKISAEELGIRPTRASGVPVSLNLRGTATPLKVAAVLGPEAVGALSQAFVATMPLGNLQKLAGLQHRVTRILVQSKPGHEATVRAQLGVLADGRITVASADQDVALLHQALRPSDQASEFFAVIAGLLGFLFAFNALLLTIPERRQTIASLRLIGTKRTAIVQMVVFQALCLGTAASLVGLLAGYALSVGLLHQSAGYLTQAFTLSAGTVLGWGAVVLPLLGGILASCLASMVPLLDLRRGRALDAVYREDDGNRLGQRAPRILAAIAGVLFLLATGMFILMPTLALLACLVLALATVLAIPLIFAGVLRAAGALARRNQQLTILPVALMSLRATTLRSLALAATGALALFGCVALGGARDDLLRGIEGYIQHYVAGADIWVVNPNDPTAVEPLPDSYATRVAHIPGVSNVHLFQSSYLDIGKRRVWVVARPPGTTEGLLGSQIVDGNAHSAAAHIDAGGWIAASQQIAEEHHAKVGDTLTIPTPTGNIIFRIAATTTNLTWSPGAILISTTDYRHAWRTSAPTAIAIDLSRGTNIPEAQHVIAQTIGSVGGIETFTPSARAAKTSAVAREGLSKLNDISILLLLAAIIATLAALTSAIWQRRAALAALRLTGIKPQRLRRILLVEASLMLIAACMSGAIAGLYGQAIIDSYLKHVTGFPVARISAGWRPLEIFILVIVIVLSVVTIPGWLASRVSPALALES
jgi:putative ABC transport system permease protein